METASTRAPGSQPSAVQLFCSRIRAGDEQAFAAFYDCYSRRVYALVLSLTRADEHLARELHQIVMIRASRKLPILESEEAIWSWLAQVARNAFFDHLRARSRAVKREADNPLDASTGDEPPELVSRLEPALLSLSPEERALIDDYYFNGCSQSSIAGATGTSIKGIQGRLARIRARLRAILLRSMKDE